MKIQRSNVSFFSPFFKIIIKLLINSDFNHILLALLNTKLFIINNLNLYCITMRL